MQREVEAQQLCARSSCQLSFNVTDSLWQSAISIIDRSHKLHRTETVHTSNFTTSGHAEPLLSILNHDYIVLKVGYGADVGETIYI